MFENPVLYSEINKCPAQTTREVLQEYLQYIKFGENDLILDAGCGTGNVTADVLIPALPRSDFRLVAVDKHQVVVDYAKNYFNDPRVSFHVVDLIERDEQILKSAFTKEELDPGFDIVFSFSLLQWTLDMEQCLKNIYSLMRPGGQALFWFVGFSSLPGLWQTVISKQKWQPYLKMEPLFKFELHDSPDPASECTDLLKRIGFKDIICECVLQPMFVGSRHYARKCLQCIDPYIHKIPEHLRDEYMDDIMMEFNPMCNRTYGMPHHRLAVVTTKPKN